MAFRGRRRAVAESICEASATSAASSIQWSAAARDYDVATSLDGKEWTVVRSVKDSNGGRDYLQTPNAAARFIRVNMNGGDSYAIDEITIQPPRFGDRIINVYQRMAHDALRGRYPRGLIGELAYWTIFGVDRDTGAKPLLSEDGAIETPAGFTLEPFVRIDGRLMTWADVSTTQSLEQSSLPMPSTTWHHPKFTLEIAPFGAGTAAAPIGYARYRLRNTSAHPERAQFYVAVRPLRVTPPWFELNINELTAPIRSITWTGTELAVDDTRVVPLTKPTSVAHRRSTAGMRASCSIRRRRRTRVIDPQRHASALMLWDLTLAPGEEKIIDVATPLHAHDAQPIPRDVARQRATAIAYWRKIADHVDIDIPAARDLVDTVRANVAYNLLGRDGPAIRGGARNYRRSWIRDGSLASTMLLRFGLDDEVRDYIRWFAPYQFADGKSPLLRRRARRRSGRGARQPRRIHLPRRRVRAAHRRPLARARGVAARREGGATTSTRCAIKRRGEAAARSTDFCRRRSATKATPRNRCIRTGTTSSALARAERRRMARRAHSASTTRRRASPESATNSRATFTRRSAARSRCTTSTTSPAPRTSATSIRPRRRSASSPAATSRTSRTTPSSHEFERATGTNRWRAWKARRAWKDYTPYELRQVGDFVRLGWRDRAQRLLALLPRRPPPARLEAVGRGRRAGLPQPDVPRRHPAPLGRLRLRPLLPRHARLRARIRSGAGPRRGNPGIVARGGVRVRGLRTIYGPLNFSMRRSGKRIIVNISGVRVPRGGIVLRLPGVGERIVRHLPATLELER